jgi:TusA-related sulfurtransferase
MTINEIKKQEKGELEILVDTDTSKENVIRSAENEGWQVKETQPDGEGYKIFISKG